MKVGSLFHLPASKEIQPILFTFWNEDFHRQFLIIWTISSDWDRACNPTKAAERTVDRKLSAVRQWIETVKTTLSEKCRTSNARFGASGGGNSADNFVQIWTFVSRSKCSVSRHYAKPLSRCMQGVESVVEKALRLEKLVQSEKQCIENVSDFFAGKCCKTETVYILLCGR